MGRPSRSEHDVKNRADDPRYWRDKAEEMRASADYMSESTKKTLLRMADDYDGMARKIEERWLKREKRSSQGAG